MKNLKTKNDRDNPATAAIAKKVQRVLVMAGGTGGHIFPALAVARGLSARGVEVAWMGTAAGLESKIIPNENIPLYTVSVAGLRGKGWWRWCVAPFTLVRALYQSWKIIRRFQPDVVLGMGGFAAGPGGVAAWLLRKRLVIHEQNAVMGLTNRWLNHLADVLLTGFPMGLGRWVGNPIRQDIAHISDPSHRLVNRPSGSLRLLVLGGSLGAASLNQGVPVAMENFAQTGQVEIWHQTGQRSLEQTRAAYAAWPKDRVRITAFIEDMVAAYTWADVVVCRAGASTIAELCAVGLGALLVPYPYAVDDHQTANAQFLVQAGAAILCAQSAFHADILKKECVKWMTDRSSLLRMAQSARKQRKTEATQLIIQELCHD